LRGFAPKRLITILVGLSAVERGLIKGAPPELRTTWNPRDPAASAARSRIMVLEMTLVRATDALDAYISWSRREPALVQREELKKSIDSAQQSVFTKFCALKVAFGGLDPVICALIEVMITWRNKSVYTLSENLISRTTMSAIDAHKERIKNEFSGLLVDHLFTDFERGGPPTFKEMASFIRATQSLVESLDAMQLSALVARDYLHSFVLTLLTRNGGEKAPATSQLVQSIWGRDDAGRHKRLRSFLINNGLSETRVSGDSCEFSDELIDDIASLAPRGVLAYLKAGA
jgi:hypothetical protein